MKHFLLIATLLVPNLAGLDIANAQSSSERRILSWVYEENSELVDDYIANHFEYLALFDDTYFAEKGPDYSRQVLMELTAKSLDIIKFYKRYSGYFGKGFREENQPLYEESFDFLNRLNEGSLSMNKPLGENSDNIEKIILLAYRIADHLERNSNN